LEHFERIQKSREYFHDQFSEFPSKDEFYSKLKEESLKWNQSKRVCIFFVCLFVFVKDLNHFSFFLEGSSSFYTIRRIEN